MKSCSYGTTCRTPPTTTYSPEPREARRPTASPSALASRDIAETHTPRARVCQGRERARHEPGWSAQGRWRWSGPTGWAHTRVVRPMSDRPSKECRIHVENNPPPPTVIIGPVPLAPRVVRGLVDCTYVYYSQRKVSRRARASRRARDSRGRPPSSLVFLSSRGRPSPPPPRLRRETVAPRTPRARAGTSSPTGHARARSLLIGAGRRPRAAPSLKSSRGGSG